MKRLLQILGVAIALAWVPITSHCAWENISGLELFKCAEEAPQPQKNDCNDDACAQLENGFYKTSETDTPVPPPCFTTLLPYAVVEPPPVEKPSPMTASPPEIPACWMFVHRTALPPRAPSLA